jgi:hypothetical protein
VATQQQTHGEKPPVGYYAFLGIIALVSVAIAFYLITSYFS